MSVKTSEPVSEPDVVGAKATAIWQVFEPLVDGIPVEDVVQVFAAFEVSTTKFVLALMLLKTRFAPPVLVTVTSWSALCVPTDCEPKVRLVGVALSVVPEPEPESATVCVEPGVPPASSVTVSVADSAPDIEGVNVTLIVQLAPDASEPSQLSTSLKSPEGVPEAGAIVTLEISSGPPVAISVALCAALAKFTGWVPKASVAGESVAVAGATRNP